VVSRAMAPLVEERFPSMDAILSALGAPASSPVVAKGLSVPPPKKATPESNTASGMAIGDTLQVPVHPNAPAPQPKSRRGVLLGAAVVLLIAGGLVTWRVRSGSTTQSSRTAMTTSAAPVTSASTADVASAAPSASPVTSAVPSASTTTTSTTTTSVVSAP